MDEIEQLIAYARSQKYSEAEIKAKLQEMGIPWPGDTSLAGSAGLKNIGRSAIQGATLNFGDEILGMLPEWLGGGEQAKEEMRANDKAFSKAHPFVSGAANVAGGFVLPGGAAAKGLKGSLGVTKTILKGAGIGGIAGALSGAGASEGGLGERASAAVVPGALGAGLGAVIPGLPAAVRAGFSPTARARNRVGDAVRRSGGAGALQGRLKEFVDAGRGQDVTMGDLTLPLQQATDFAANASDETAELVSKIAGPRQASAPGRILNDVTRKTKNPVADDIVNELAKDTQTWADGPTGYGGLRSQNPVIVPAMADDFQRLLDSPRVKTAWDQAAEVGLIGPMPKSGSVSFDVMQGAAERLATAKEVAFGRRANDLAFRLKAAHEELIKQMDTAVPGFKPVSQEYAKRKTLERMVRRGEEIFDEEDTRSLAKEISTLTPDQLTKVKEGLASKMITSLRSAQTNQNVARRLIARSASMEDKLRLLFGTSDNFEEFIKRIEVERELSKMMHSLGGSQTARRQMAQAVDPAAIATEAAVSPSAAAFVAARNVLPKYLSSRTAREMGPTLTTQGSTAIEDLLRKWNVPPSLVPYWAGRMAPAAAGAGVGNVGQ